MSDVQKSSGNVFADLGVADAAGHSLKAQLVGKLAAIIAERGLNQTAAARAVGISQPDMSRLLNGRFRDVSLERLLRMLQRLNCEVEINVHHAGCDVGHAIHIEAELV